MSNTGRRLRETNEEILKYMQQLRDQRNELGFLVEKQKTEKANLEAEMARISYKLGLINKSLSQRNRALKLYDATIMEIEAKYKGLADSTQGLLTHVRNESSHLENSIDKRIGTEKECADCPRCDTIIQNQNQNIINLEHRKSHEKDPAHQISGHPNEVPTKQMSETERRRQESRTLSHAETDSRNLTSNPIYSRAMEYPMMLTPMIDKEQMEHMKEKLTSSNVNSQHAVNMPRTSSKIDNVRVQNGSTSHTVSLSVNQPLCQKDIEREIVSRSSLGTGNFLDGDYSDTHPSRDTPEKSFPKPKEESTSKDITPLESPVPSSVDYTSTPIDGEEKEKLAIDEYDEVLEDGESGPRSKKTTLTNGAKYSSSVDIFGQAYKTQHELRSNPPSLARYKKSVFNKRDQSLFVTEENS